MRATATLSDAAAQLVTQYAETQRVSLSRAISDLIERSAVRKSRIKLVDGIPVFDVPADGPKINFEDVKRFESEGY